MNLQNIILWNLFIRIGGTQTWLREYPSGLAARCHFYEGKFSVEELTINPGIISGIQFDLEQFLSNDYRALDVEEQIAIEDEITKKFDENVRSSDFSDAEGECLLSEGLLGVLKMRCPEIEQNEVFNFYVKLNNTIQDLETRFQGHPYSDIISEIQSHLQNEDSEDYNIWKAIHFSYNENYTWVMDTETGKDGQREEFLKDLEKAEQLNAKKHMKEEKTGAEKIIEFMEQNGLSSHDLSLALSMTLAKTTDKTNAEQHIHVDKDIQSPENVKSEH